MSARVRGAAVLWPGPVVIVGPSGAGKTGVLLAAVGAGAVPVDGEEVVVDEGGLRGATGRVRLRARHLREAPRSAAGLRRAERARLRAAAAFARLPRVGERIGRRVFVDAPLDAIAPPSATARGPLTCIVLLPPVADLEPREVVGAEAVDALRGHVTGDPAELRDARVWRLPRRPGELDAEVARRIGELVGAPAPGAP